MNEALRDRARGRWHGLLPSLGVDSRYLTGKHTGCPICRDGKDRFRFDDKDGTGTWICSRCGAGDGISLVMQVNGWSFKNAAVEIEKLIGCVPFRPSSEVRSDRDQRRVMNRVWREARPVETGDPVARYLLARTGLVSFPACIRTAARLCHDADVTSFHPAMVAMVTGADGKPVNIHRTYLTLGGTKAPLEEPRRLMPGKVPHGSAIRLTSTPACSGSQKALRRRCRQRRCSMCPAGQSSTRRSCRSGSCHQMSVN